MQNEVNKIFTIKTGIYNYDAYFHNHIFTYFLTFTLVNIDYNLKKGRYKNTFVGMLIHFTICLLYFCKPIL